MLPEALAIWMEQSAQRNACRCPLIATRVFEPCPKVRDLFASASLLTSLIRLAMKLQPVSRVRGDDNDGTDAVGNVPSLPINRSR